MIEISQIRLSVDHDDEALQRALLRKLRVDSGQLRDWKIHRRAIDARKKEDGGIRLIYTIHAEVVDEEEKIIAAARSPDVRPATQVIFAVPQVPAKDTQRPVIIGAGPCGYFAALSLARAGLRPIILERGKAAGPRARDVTRSWRGESDVDPESNVQFGEGGAGTFSDGKLYTGIKDRDGAVRFVLEELAAHGAPEDILVKGKPHIGTDRLISVLRSLRSEILELGGEIRFETRLDDILLENGSLRGLRTAGGDEIEVSTTSGGKLIYFTGTLDDEGKASGNFKIDYLLYDIVGMDLTKKSNAMLDTLSLLPKVILPFLIMILVSLFTRKNSRPALDRYYVKMKTPVFPNGLALSGWITITSWMKPRWTRCQ